MREISSEQLKQMNIGELEALASEIRTFLIETVSSTGGHLASNLGVVELTIALHYVFDLPTDKLVWDVGHQSYVHKILTGRGGQLHTLRQYGGLSGFPKRSESACDAFDTGHSSTSISAALGMARARNLSGESYHVVAVIGDGALTGGMAFEALEDAGQEKKNFIVVLNDNEMSISPNVGSLSTYLTSLRTRPGYFQLKRRVQRSLECIPFLGQPLVRMLKRVKDGVRHLITRNNLFEQLGFAYLGPTDGHNIATLIKVFQTAKKMDYPVLIHTFTKKGKGYRFAEENPSGYHGVNEFSVDTGILPSASRKLTYSSAFGRELAALGKTEERLCAITAAMPDGTGLSLFSGLYPDRFFDVGIAEQHAVCFAAGLAVSGYVPVFAVYSSFLQRAYDQVLHDVCLQNLKVILAIDRAGLVGEDGETHQGIFDLSFLLPMPNLAILAPASPAQLTQMVRYAVREHVGPIAIRYPRGARQADVPQPDFAFGKACMLTEGTDVCLLCVGSMCETGLAAAARLSIAGISAAVADLRTVKPLDVSFLQACAKRFDMLVTLEDGVLSGGVGEAIAMLMEGYGGTFLHKGHRDPIVPHGKVEELYRHCGLDADTLCREIVTALSAQDAKSVG